ncbi:hypothetical protein NJT12_19150 [Flavobacterium sp. AC]|uniref:Tetratricopeptide repeat protein n=1 Tax=Flavobacterium azizsancarii TaxID=2961580 RepID=A0ABT4WHQ7_9FLAO|nr:hypothetical protein [Flavobacterium azizsancarii]MDA6071747.1 hypothetical protein [Flavobacterium azizsancarii]
MNLKITIGYFVILFLSFKSFSQVKPQKVDLDKFSFNVNYQILPKKFVPLEKRTFSSEAIINKDFVSFYPNKETLNGRINVYGWKKSVRYSNIDVEINLKSFTMGEPKLESRIDESKDKNGVMVKTTYYFVIAKIEAKGSGVVKIKSAISDSGKDEENTYAFDEDYIYKSNNDNVNPEAVKELFKKQKDDFYNEKIKTYVELVLNQTNRKVNKMYGLEATSYRDNLWIIDSKDEEGAIQKEALEAVKVIFSKMTATSPIDGIVSEMSPLIEYFDSLKTKYTENDKSSKKIRYSAYYNLGRIYIHLDQPEKAIKEGEGLIANDYDKKDGQRIIDDANYDLEVFKSTAFKSKHNPAFY